MSKFHQLIKDAAAYIDGEELPGRSLVAIALLMQADLELKLEEREVRRSGLAHEMAQRLHFELPILSLEGYVKIIPTPDGLGFVISVEYGERSEHRPILLRIWDATAPFREAGWKFTFAFRSPCGEHIYFEHGPGAEVNILPFCIHCGHVPKVAQ